MFRTSHLMILISYTIFSLILIGESLLLSWEGWAIILIAAGVATGWVLHILQILNDYSRLWVYSFLMMATFFFYGIHETSAFDMSAIMLVVIMLYTMTGIKPLVAMCQITYLITFSYDLILMFLSGTVFDSLMITRAMLHVALMMMAGWTGRIIIDRWGRVLGRSHVEIGELKEGTERLNDFLANLSHEIRTPINAVIGLTGLCIEKEKDADIRKNMESVVEAGRRVAEQISDILDYSEIDRGNLIRNDEDYTLSSVIYDLVNEIAPVKKPDIELIIDVDPAIPIIMNTDVSKLKKIIRHLIMNGIKYTNKGGVYVRFTSVKEEYGINLCIEVTDTGIGMEEWEQTRIFDDFYQGDSSRIRIRGGLGLGLTIVSGFVASLGGFMTFKSEPGKGTSVRVSLPQKVIEGEHCMSLTDKDSIRPGAFFHFEKFADPGVREYYNLMMKNLAQGVNIQIRRVDSLDDLKKLSEKVKLTHLLVGQEEFESDVEFMLKLAKEMIVVVAAYGEFVPPENSDIMVMTKPVYSFQVTEFLNMRLTDRQKRSEKLMLKGVRALVVDDERMNLAVAKGILQRYGMDIECVNSGSEAISICKEKDFDVIFMDHMMPEMDGIEAMKRIRSDRSRDRRDIPFVALTANAVSSARERFIAEGFDGFLCKPIELGELERVMKKVLPKNLIEYVTDDFEDFGLPETNTASAASTAVYGNDAKQYEKLKSEGVDVGKGIRYCQHDTEFYKSLLLQFAEEYSEKKYALKRAFYHKDIKDYEIRTHALKSTSKMIGAVRLSGLAKAEEDLAKAGREPNQDLFDEMMDIYERTVFAINVDLNPGGNSGENKDRADTGSGDGDIIEFAPEEE